MSVHIVCPFQSSFTTSVCVGISCFDVSTLFSLCYSARSALFPQSRTLNHSASLFNFKSEHHWGNLGLIYRPTKDFYILLLPVLHIADQISNTHLAKDLKKKNVCVCLCGGGHLIITVFEDEGKKNPGSKQSGISKFQQGLCVCALIPRPAWWLNVLLIN